MRSSSSENLVISGFNIARPSTQEFRITITASESLSSLQVSLSGPESATFTLTGFTETSTSGGDYTYETTYQISSPGEFEAILEQASDADGNTAGGGRTVRVSVDPVSEIWTYETGNTILSTPAWWDNKVYFGSYDNSVYALNASTGEEEWTFETDGEVGSSPIVTDGTVFIGSRDGRLYSLDADSGEQRWSFNANNDVYYFDKITSTIYTNGYSSGYGLFAVDVASGSEQWFYGTNSSITSVAAGGGSVYIQTFQDGVQAVDTMTGESEWSFSARGEQINLIDDTLYVGGYDNNLYAVDANDGTEQWRFEGIRYPYPTEVDDIVYAGGDNVYAIDSLSGDEIWVWEDADDAVYTTPVVTNDTVYVGSRDTHVYALSAEDGSEQWAFETGGQVDSGVTAVNDTLYVPCEDGNLYALGTPFSEL